MEIVENNANKKLVTQYEIRCKNCGSILLADDTEISFDYLFPDVDKWREGVGIFQCPCCNASNVEVEILADKGKAWISKN